MLDFTRMSGVPYLIEDTYRWEPFYYAQGLANSPGPFDYGNIRFVGPVAWGEHAMGFLKTTDGGATWSRIYLQNEGHHHNPGDFELAYYQTKGQRVDATTVRFLVNTWIRDAVPTTITRNLVDFDLTTETYSALSGDAPGWDGTGNDYGDPRIHYDHINDADFVFTFRGPFLTPTSICFSRRVAGSWDAGETTFFTIPTGKKVRICGTVTAADGSTYISLFTYQGGAYWYVVRVLSDGTVSDQWSGALDSYMTSAGEAAAIGGKAVIPFAAMEYTYFTYPGFVLVGDADGFSVVNLPSRANVKCVQAVTAAVYNRPASTGWLWWIEEDRTGEPPINRVHACTFDGTTMGDVLTAQDEAEYETPQAASLPPVEDPPYAVEFYSDLTQPVMYSNGRWAFLLSMVWMMEGDEYSRWNSFYWEFAAAASAARGWAVIGRGPASVKLGAGQGYAHCS